MAGIIAKQNQQIAEGPKKMGINEIMNATLDSSKMRKRFDEILGERTPQFLSSIVSLVNSSEQLQSAMRDSPMTVIQSALRAATYDLPIDPTLGYAYILPFRNNKKGGIYEASFVPGYKGLKQLCLRTGAYSRVPDAVDVREGELIKYDRLTGDVEFKWVEDEDEREKLPVIGYAGYFRLRNGAEKTIYWSCKKIRKHEEKNRKGKYMSPLWKSDFDAMARKTVIRELCTKHALMSIEYRNMEDGEAIRLAQQVMNENDEPEETLHEDMTSYTDADYEEVPMEYEGSLIDEATGEVVEADDSM